MVLRPVPGRDQQPQLCPIQLSKWVLLTPARNEGQWSANQRPVSGPGDQSEAWTLMSGHDPGARGRSDNVLTVCVSGGAWGRGEGSPVPRIIMTNAPPSCNWQNFQTESDSEPEPLIMWSRGITRLHHVDRTNVLFRHPRLMQMFHTNKTPQISVHTNCQ